MKGLVGMKRSEKTIIGLTGNSGSGKTSVAEILHELGAFAIDADKIAHKVMQAGQAAYQEIIAAFGTEILQKQSEEKPAPIDRKKLGAIVFNNAEKRTQLEDIVHPIVCEKILAEAAASKSAIVVIDAVLLVESGLHHHCDAVWLITAPEDQRLKRIITRDSLSIEAAEARMRNQRDTTKIAKIAQSIIQNTGTKSELKQKTIKALTKMGVKGASPLAGDWGRAPRS